MTELSVLRKPGAVIRRNDSEAEQEDTERTEFLLKFRRDPSKRLASPFVSPLNHNHNGRAPRPSLTPKTRLDPTLPTFTLVLRNDDLQRICRRASRQLNSFLGLLERKPVSDKFTHVESPAEDQLCDFLLQGEIG